MFGKPDLNVILCHKTDAAKHILNQVIYDKNLKVKHYQIQT